MKFLIRIFRQYIRNNWIAEGYEDEHGFHFGKPPVNKKSYSPFDDSEKYHESFS